MSRVNLAASPSGTYGGTNTTPIPARDTVLDAVEGVNWRAVFAGGVAATALSLILFILGVGLGLASASPWTFRGASATTLAVSAIVWVIFTQLAASGVGGYMAGRLRGRWTRLRDHEVYFRDTAHGLLAWGISTLLMATLATITVGNTVDQATRVTGAAATVAQAAMTGSNDDSNTSAYWVDAMLRNDPTTAGAATTLLPVLDPATDASTRAQATHIIVRSLKNGTLAPEDSRYLAQIVSQRTGMPVADAQRRVTDTYARARKSIDDAQVQARQAADEARKATSYTAMWMFVALLAGAFVSAWLATYGGRQRDAAVVNI